MATGRIQGYIAEHGRFAIVFYSIAHHSNSMLFYFWATPHGTWDVSSFLSLMFSHSVVSDSLRPHGPQHARPPCPSPTLRACSNSCPSSRWCHPVISPLPSPSPPAFSDYQTLTPPQHKDGVLTTGPPRTPWPILHTVSGSFVTFVPFFTLTKRFMCQRG